MLLIIKGTGVFNNLFFPDLLEHAKNKSGNIFTNWYLMNNLPLDLKFF